MHLYLNIHANVFVNKINSNLQHTIVHNKKKKDIKRAILSFLTKDKIIFVKRQMLRM